MVGSKLNRALCEIRWLNPDVYLAINHLYRKTTGTKNTFKLKTILANLIVFLEDFLTQCEAKFIQLQAAVPNASSQGRGELKEFSV